MGHLLNRCRCKLHHRDIWLDVARRLINHIRHIDTVSRYHVTRDGEVEQVSHAATIDLDVDLGAARPLEELHHLIIINTHASDETVTDINDSVAR